MGWFWLGGSGRRRDRGRFVLLPVTRRQLPALVYEYLNIGDFEQGFVVTYGGVARGEIYRCAFDPPVPCESVFLLRPRSIPTACRAFQ